ncbi:UNKNOWN [Stylonychia lemnae]|uniref:C2H2-type domain-containing protein n=1 Tax=Stylonychia lemnae TaxID=5949 RepID=A0A078A302_STYLE|nr:UNKNOWN [Stylonychia lemnae]|eukprot:CDW75149.1 UNKNOWN [Stylonychia lemnae]
MFDEKFQVVEAFNSEEDDGQQERKMVLKDHEKQNNTIVKQKHLYSSCDINQPQDRQETCPYCNKKFRLTEISDHKIAHEIHSYQVQGQKPVKNLLIQNEPEIQIATFDDKDEETLQQTKNDVAINQKEEDEQLIQELIKKIEEKKLLEKNSQGKNRMFKAFKSYIPSVNTIKNYIPKISLSFPKNNVNAAAVENYCCPICDVKYNQKYAEQMIETFKNNNGLVGVNLDDYGIRDYLKCKQCVKTIQDAQNS